MWGDLHYSQTALPSVHMGRESWWNFEHTGLAWNERNSPEIWHWDVDKYSVALDVRIS